MSSKTQTINWQNAQKALQKLEQGFGYKVDIKLIPEVFLGNFYKAAERFSKETIQTTKMGYAEEAGDITYQTLKLIGIDCGAMTSEKMGKLHKMHKSKFKGGILTVDYDTIYLDAFTMLDKKDIQVMMKRLPDDIFAHNYDRARDYLANQQLSYVSRSLNPKQSGGGFHTPEYVKATKFPEEVAELVDVLSYPNQRLKGEEILNDMIKRLENSQYLVSLSKGVIKDVKNSEKLLYFLDDLLHQKLENVGLEEVLGFTLFKIRGRQELSFKGYNTEDVHCICKPLEYLMEADLMGKKEADKDGKDKTGVEAAKA